MRIYNYTEDSGELVGERDARIWPGREHLSDDDIAKFQIPAHATSSAPPPIEPGHAAIFVDGTWKLAKDYRGETWFSADGTPVVISKIGGPKTFLPELYAEAPPPPPPAPPSPNDVRAEASNRMQAIVGARDADHLEVIISNATREAVRLLRKGQENWTRDEAARAAALEQVDADIESIRTASNGLESHPPLDYTNDHHWP